MIPKKLKCGDEIRIIAPSDSISTIKKEAYEKALRMLSKSFVITFSKHCYEEDETHSSSIQSRVEDLKEAFENSRVKAVLAATGGFNVNQLLEHIDYSSIKRNPKILCGFSDITALLNAVHSQTGLVTYHGADFVTMGVTTDPEYTKRYWEACLLEEGPYHLEPSKEAKKYIPIQEGSCEGQIIGGNLCTLNLLQGTKYMPDLNDKILFLEEQNTVGDYFLYEFDRDLQSLLQDKNLKTIKGVVFGRFKDDCNMNVETVTRMVKNKNKLQGIPIAFHVDFGHIELLNTFPIGGTASMRVLGGTVDINIIQH